MLKNTETTRIPPQVQQLIKNNSFDKGIDLRYPEIHISDAMWVSDLVNVHIMDELVSDYPLRYEDISRWISGQFTEYPVQVGLSDSGEWYLKLCKLTT